MQSLFDASFRVSFRVVDHLLVDVLWDALCVGNDESYYGLGLQRRQRA